MITEAILGIGIGFLRWVLDAIPTVDVPEWFTGSNSTLGIIFEQAGSMGAWIPLPLVFTCGAAIVGCTLVSFLLKTTRILLSLFTAGGGSAG